MTMLVTESSFSSLDQDVTNRKRRRMDVHEGATEINTEAASIMINPVTQQFNRPNMVVPDFNCAAVLHNQISRLQLSSMFVKYKAVVLFFYECDFTPTACKDIALINNNTSRFESLGTIPLAMSTDTEMVHSAFATQSNLGFVPSFPLVSDTTRSVSRHLNLINSETGLAQRSAFIIDRTRQVKFSFLLQDNRLVHPIDTICNILQTL